MLGWSAVTRALQFSMPKAIVRWSYVGIQRGCHMDLVRGKEGPDRVSTLKRSEELHGERRETPLKNLGGPLRQGIGLVAVPF